MDVSAAAIDNIIKQRFTGGTNEMRLFCISAILLCAWAWSQAALSAQPGEDAQDRYRKWLEEDVAYLATPEERDVFLRLATDQERDRFIESFWLRRDPTPSTRVNEAKDEHYRRIAYSNENFSSGWDGWKTDRGRIYITFGPPDERRRQPAGGRYQRPADEGGGVTRTYPFEVWHYRHLPGVGSGVSIEFVDRSGSGDYRIALSPDEKDALLFTPGLGATLDEANGLPRSARVRRLDTLRPLGLQGDIALEGRSAPLFDRLQQYFALQRPPRLLRPQLKAMADASVSYDGLRFESRIDAFRLSEQASMLPLTVWVENRNLVFSGQENAGFLQARVDLYGRVERLDRSLAYEFEDRLTARIAVERKVEGLKRKTIYQKALPLRPGRYKLVLVLRDPGASRAGKQERSLYAPRMGDQALSLSSLVLAETIQPIAADESMPAPFALAGAKVYPLAGNRIDRRYHKHLGLYFEVYNAGIDASSGLPDVEISYSLQRQGRSEALRTKNPSDLKQVHHHGISVVNVFALDELPPGRYRLSVLVRDRIREARIGKEAGFSIR